MASTDNHILHDGRQRKADEAQEFLEERAHLLDTIREMINVEMDRRRVGTDNGNCQSKTPSETKPRKLSFCNGCAVCCEESDICNNTKTITIYNQF